MERETLEMDVVFVGAGPANLSGALHLANLVKKHNEEMDAGTRGQGDTGMGRRGGTKEISSLQSRWAI